MPHAADDGHRAGGYATRQRFVVKGGQIFGAATAAHQQNNIGALTHSSYKTCVETRYVLSNFFLADNAFIGTKNVFDRLLNRHNVFRLRCVDMLQHGS